jgi:hypothetical protein
VYSRDSLTDKRHAHNDADRYSYALPYTGSANYTGCHGYGDCYGDTFPDRDDVANSNFYQSIAGNGHTNDYSYRYSDSYTYLYTDSTTFTFCYQYRDTYPGDQHATNGYSGSYRRSRGRADIH